MKAYPFSHRHPTTGVTTSSEGMDLRDYFAGLAMQATVQAWIARDIYPPTDLDVANNAYRIADAMMLAREPKDEQS